MNNNGEVNIAELLIKVGKMNESIDGGGSSNEGISSDVGISTDGGISTNGGISSDGDNGDYRGNTGIVDSVAPKGTFYNLKDILKNKAQYNMIFGERSNGKTFACLEMIVRNYWNNGKQGAYLRRWKEDFRGKRGETLFDSLISEGKIAEITNGNFSTVKYYSGKWHLANYDKELGKNVYEQRPFMYGFSLSDMEHDKSTSYPEVTTIVFDEFMTRGMYLNNEFVLFCNVLSTIIRHRDNVTIFMLGNTVNKYCPYFREMGLKNVPEMEAGKIDVYQYGTSGLKVAVERTGTSKRKKKASDIYFAFDNPSLQMITGGAWEIDLYPHSPCKYVKEDIVFRFFINFDGNLLQCDIVNTYWKEEEKDDDGFIDSERANRLAKSNPAFCDFMFIHEKTTPIKDENSDLVFSESYGVRPNWFRNILKDPRPIVGKLRRYFKEEKVYYQDNEVGEIVRNYVNWCKSC